ncbi:DUF3592 domain-containing protein [Spirosoma sordidisoli]|uniref:DUF3592 domain-containing protein n=1 Tax=Spirosoma sordidisoli TaxID=2502893 RepID=A0A4Q2UKJ6_9BACT|nr:DUF3592 domain-containing protein [Spirosoma sordidisoli]RYC68151.1 hypothetical protein EQG79_22130 [Spirosoma sordidisoli]
MNVPFAFTILTISGLFLIGVLIFILVRFRNQLKNGIRVSGTLVDYEAKASSRGQTAYHPIVEFKTILGER